MPELRTVTLLDIRLGHVHLTEDQRDQLQRAAVPVLAQVARRLMREQAAAAAPDYPVGQAAAGQQEE